MTEAERWRARYEALLHEVAAAVRASLAVSRTVSALDMRADAASLRARLQTYSLEERLRMFGDLFGNTLDVLRSVEWEGGSMDRVGACPSCGQVEDEGHAATCRVGKALSVGGPAT